MEEKPRTYRNKAHKDSLKYMRSRKHNVKKTREAIRKQLQYLRRDLSIVDSMLQSGLKLSQKQQLRLCQQHLCQGGALLLTAGQVVGMVL